MNTIKTNLYFQKLGKELVKGSLNALVFRLIGFVMGYLFTLLIAWKHGPSVLGEVILAIIILEFAGIINSFGFEVVIASLAAEYNSRNEERQIVLLYIKILKMLLFIGTLVSAAIYFSAETISLFIFKKTELPVYLQIMSFAVLPLSIIRLNSQLFRGLKNIVKFATFNYVSVYLLSIFFLILLPSDSINKLRPAYAFSAAAVVGMILSTLLVFGVLKDLHMKAEFENPIKYRELTRKSIPLLFAEILNYTKQWGIVLIIGLYLANSMVGIFSLTSKLASVAGLLIVAVNAVALPELAEHYGEGNQNKIQKALQQSAKLIYFTGIPAVAVLYLISPIILKFVGQDFMSVSWMLLLLCLTQIVEMLSGTASILLQVVNKQRVFRNIVILETLFLFLLGIILIPRFGLNGAAGALLLSSFARSLLLIYYSKKNLNVITYINPFNKKADDAFDYSS